MLNKPFFLDATDPGGSKPPYFLGFTITFDYSHYIR